LAPNKQSVLINKNGYAVAKNVDLSKGLSAITVMAKGTAASRLEVRLDKADGERIAMFMVGTEAKELNFNTTASVTGTHDLYFVDTMDGSITFDYWQAKAADGTVVTPPVGDEVNPYNKVEAENANALTDAKVTPNKQSVMINENGYILVQNVDFSKGLSGFKVYAQSSKPGVKLNVYFDDATTPAGTVNVGTDMTKALDLNVSTDLTGTHYIYFEAAKGAVTLDAWQAVEKSGSVVVTPPVGQTVDPYNKVEAENSNALTNAMLSPNKQSVVISDNGYILVQNVDFSKGLSGFGVFAQTNLPKVKLNVYIDDATEPIGSVSVGIDMTKPVYIKLPAGTNVTGTHYIYFEAKGSSVTLDSWNAMPAGSTPIDQPPVVEPPVYEDINPYNKVEAESIPSASYTNAMLTPSKQAVSIMNGGNVVAKNVVFSNGVSEFKVVAGSTASAKLEVRLGSATGTLLGSATVSGDAKELTIKSSQNLSGKKDIYFVSANGVISFDSWKVTEYKEPVVTPPVVETGVKASYKENSWNDGYQLNFTVTNSSGKTINSWKVKVKKSDINVSQSWCVNVSQEGDYYVFTPMSYNSTLANGQSTEFGMIGRGQVGSTINYTVE
ncbi:carbohydrate-binding protein, partial [Butyrivibrio sp. X503]|uniref:carbohydrate-binding protein n=1 Tax=Butyrivibrio sp. X503 TaxID=2364878 RepID=UPI000EA8B88A